MNVEKKFEYKRVVLFFEQLKFNTEKKIYLM